MRASLEPAVNPAALIQALRKSAHEPDARLTTWARTVPPALEQLDARVTSWIADHCVFLTRVALGIVFVWFGVLKFFPDASPAADLASRTIERITFGRVHASPGLYILASWEVLIGVGFLTGRFMRATLLLLLVHMAGTLTPLALFPSETFQVFPYSPTLEGQYIIKNLVLVGAALVVGAAAPGKTSPLSRRR
jgi:uncharacterized membrane protein YphA (DoxX/SURF4 family)